MRVLMITSEWPSPETPYAVPFIIRQVELLEQEGVNVDIFNFRGAKNPLNYLRSWRHVHQCLANTRYDLIHAQWGQSALLALPKTLPLIITFRGDDVKGIIKQNGYYSTKGKVLQQISRWVAHQANEAIAVSEELMMDLGISKCHIIPSGINLELFFPTDMVNARKTLGLSQTKKYVLFAGDINNPRKRFYLAKKILELVKKTEPEAELLVASGKPHERMPLYMNSSDVMLLVSIHEGSPNVVKEALACNLPIVSTNVGDVRKRMEAIAGCIICENDSPETIAQGLKKVLSNRKRIKGFQSVQELDERLITQQVISVYQQALKGSHAK